MNEKRALTLGDLRRQIALTQNVVGKNTTTGEDVFITDDTVLLSRECHVASIGDFEIRHRSILSEEERIIRLLEKLERQTTENTENLKSIMAKASDIQAALDALSAQVGGTATNLVVNGQQLNEALADINAELATLNQTIANGDVPQSVQDSVNSLAGKIAALNTPVANIASVAAQLDAINPPSESTTTTPAPGS